MRPEMDDVSPNGLTAAEREAEDRLLRRRVGWPEDQPFPAGTKLVWRYADGIEAGSTGTHLLLPDGRQLEVPMTQPAKAEGARRTVIPADALIDMHFSSEFLSRQAARLRDLRVETPKGDADAP